MISYADRIKQRAPVPAEVAAPGAPVLAVLRRHLAALLQIGYIAYALGPHSIRQHGGE